MSTIQLLRAFVNQRLTVAVEEIIGAFERTLTEYEEEIERQRRLLGAENHSGIRIKLFLVFCFFSSRVIMLFTFLEVTMNKFTCRYPHFIKFQVSRTISVICVEADVENPQSSHLYQDQTKENTEANPLATSPAQHTEAGALGEDCGGLEPTFDLDTEVLDDDWNQMIRPQPCSDTMKDSEAASHRSHNQKKLYKCPACSKTFKHNTALQRHITCHTGERPFDCTECGKTFRQKGSLQIHMRRHTGEKPFSCLVCSKNFTQSGTLVAHMRIHTGEKPFSCSVCKKRYNERGTLVRHMRVHTGEKPFTCSLCGKRFSEKGNLNKHKRIHTGEKPFSCGILISSENNENNC
uniref:C2H2-type domain-containing protein n=1 Tax=Lates calcarifer TaxID=8187 RepID=A0A4W6E715_LATCA